jgi:hypothetical protein
MKRVRAARAQNGSDEPPSEGISAAAAAVNVHGIEDRVSLGVIERLDVSAGKIEHDGVVFALTHLFQVLTQDGRFAGAGSAQQHGVGLLEPVRVGDASDVVGMVYSSCLASREG